MLAETEPMEPPAASRETERDTESDHQRLLRVRADYDNLRKRIEALK